MWELTIEFAPCPYYERESIQKPRVLQQLWNFGEKTSILFEHWRRTRANYV